MPRYLSGRAALVGVLLLYALLLHVPAAEADLASGRDKLIAGDYLGAIGDLSAVTGGERTGARTLLVEAQLTTGDYAGAEATAKDLAGDSDPKASAAGKVALSRVHHHLGRYDEAKKDVEALVKKQPANLAARHALGLALQDSGDKKGARKQWDAIYDQYKKHKIDLDDPQQLFYLAESTRYTEDFEFANDSYREAVDLAPWMARAQVAWAYLFLQKYASDLAEQTLEEVFKINPNDPDAHAAMAAAILEGRYDLASVRHHLSKAFEQNPSHVKALLARASIEIDQNQWDAARATLAEVLAVNPQSVEALSMMATIAWLRDDTAEYEAQKKKVFAINKEFAQFYRIVARSAVREHRYAEAIDLEKEAVKLNPKYWEAMAGVGEGYLRLGQEKEGLEWLNKSWAGDEYNVRTFNTLNLFEKTIRDEYGFQSTKNFKIRYHVEEKKVLSRYIEPVLEDAFADMVKRYGFTPKRPLVLEIYADTTDYSVRTVGLPNLGALGVCFGQVITAISPSNGDVNWGMVLWHELAHVFAIQLSNQRVPRWFTEGLSEYETLIARPEWRRENDADLYGAVMEGTLPSVATLNYEFMNPDGNAVIVAYYLSAVTIEYIVATYGFDAIVQGLKLFGQGKETPDVIPAITGRTIAEFDADFRKYLDVRLAPYKGTFHLPSRGYDDLVKLEIAAGAAPKDAARRADVALGYYYAGDAEGAASHAQAALDLDPSLAIARFVLAEVELRTGDVKSARQRFMAMVADGIDSFDIRARLAQIAKDAGDDAEMEQQLCAARALDPERSYPYQELGDFYLAKGRRKEALAQLEHYAMIEQMQLAPPKMLVKEYAKDGQWAKVRTYGEMALFIMPFDAEVLLEVGRAYVETGDPAKALFSYDSALLTTPALRRPALAHIGRARAFLAQNDKKKAKAAIAEALKTEPENAEALELEKKL